MAPSTRQKKPQQMSGSQGSVKNPILIRERRTAIVVAAIEVFSKKGFHNTRISDIAKAAGLSQGSIYNYIESKEGLLYLICEDHLELYQEHVALYLEQASTPRERLEKLVEATIDAMFVYRKHYTIMLRELHNIGAADRKNFMRLAARQRQTCQDIIERINATGDAISLDPKLMANLMLFIPTFIASRGWDLDIDEPRKAVLREELRVFIIRGMGMAPAA